MTERPWMIYGAYGYTGELIARRAAESGLRPVLAGRRQAALAPLSGELGLETRAVDLADGGALAAALADVDAVLHCAGPFVRTSRPMVDACLASGTHYLDITGEIAVFESVLRRGAKAKERGVVLLPGVGFDVVPTDCLAARLAAALPEATHLELAFFSPGGEASRGTLRTMVEGLPHAGAIRRDGVIEPVPIAWDAKEIPFGCGPRWAMTIPWGDVSTAYRTTGIPNIRVYTGASPAGIRRARRVARLAPALGLKPVKRTIQWWIGRTVTGPSAERRETGRTYLWGEVRDAAGERRSATLETPEGYALTVEASLECLRRVLAGEPKPGAWTPAGLFGAELAEALPGVVVGPVASQPGPNR